MPFPAYHFGPVSFLGLSLKRWLDIPVLLAAHFAVDIEVLFAEGWPVHRHWHFHTFLVGTLVGIAVAFIVFPFRRILEKIMAIIRLPYKAKLWKMLISGILGVWLHVLVDGFYHYDVQPFWPNPKNTLYRLRWITKEQVVMICVVFWILSISLYFSYILRNIKIKRSAKKQEIQNEKNN